uniref:Uncharacterized protein n=1 Tax=Acrobeloides nanus TaxID=290746 RepID=A0A914D850_9BILA
MATNVTKFNGFALNVSYGLLNPLMRDGLNFVSFCHDRYLSFGRHKDDFCWTYLSNYSIASLQLDISYYSYLYFAHPVFELGHIYLINSVQTRDGIKPYTYQDACLNNTFHDKGNKWHGTSSFCCVSWKNRQDI